MPASEKIVRGRNKVDFGKGIQNVRMYTREPKGLRHNVKQQSDESLVSLALVERVLLNATGSTNSPPFRFTVSVNMLYER